MDQKNETKKERDRRYCAQQEQCRQAFIETKTANITAQSDYIPGMPLVLQVCAASADHTVGENVFAGWLIIVNMNQLRC